MGSLVVVTDLIGHVTARALKTFVVDPALPAFISRFGFISFGTGNNLAGAGTKYYQDPMWINNDQWGWDFAGGNPTNIQYVRWFLYPGGTADIRIYY